MHHWIIFTMIADLGKDYLFMTRIMIIILIITYSLL
jgi:hypothetical protein